VILSVSNPHAIIASEHEHCKHTCICASLLALVVPENRHGKWLEYVHGQPNTPQLTESTSLSLEHAAAPHAMSPPVCIVIKMLLPNPNLAKFSSKKW
jgi:hypothetical protein